MTQNVREHLPYIEPSAHEDWCDRSEQSLLHIPSVRMVHTIIYVLTCICTTSHLAQIHFSRNFFRHFPYFRKTWNACKICRRRRSHASFTVKVAAFIGISTGATHRLVRPKLHASGNDAKSSPPSLVNFVFSQLISPCCRITGSLLSGLIRTYVYVVIQLPLKQDS